MHLYEATLEDDTDTTLSAICAAELLAGTYLMLVMKALIWLHTFILPVSIGGCEGFQISKVLGIWILEDQPRPMNMMKIS